jgi:hypothetical protein
MLNLFKSTFCAVLLLSMVQRSGYSQVTDSSKVNAGIDTVTAGKKKEKSKRYFDPDRAAMLSAVLPGAGQVYNKKYWKLPFIYGGAATFIYFYKVNNDFYIQYKKLYQEAASVSGNSQEALIYLRQRTYWRRNRDLLLISAVGAYGIVIADAYIDAHLKGFELGEDLVLRINPHTELLANGSTSKGLTFSLKF